MNAISSRQLVEHEHGAWEAEIAAAAFLARYSGRTLDAYRDDLRGFFSWAGSVGLDVLSATRPHIELYRVEMEERGLADSTIDHIDGRIPSNPAQYVRRPRIEPAPGHGMERGDLGTFLFPQSDSTEPTPRSRCSSD